MTGADILARLCTDVKIQNESQGMATPTGCRWGWCTATFESQVQLAKHVLNEHVAHAKPIKRKEIRMEVRAQDGTSVDGAPILSYDCVVSAHNAKNLLGDSSVRTSQLLSLIQDAAGTGISA